MNQSGCEILLLNPLQPAPTAARWDETPSEHPESRCPKPVALRPARIPFLLPPPHASPRHTPAPRKPTTHGIQEDPRSPDSCRLRPFQNTLAWNSSFQAPIPVPTDRNGLIGSAQRHVARDKPYPDSQGTEPPAASPRCATAPGSADPPTCAPPRVRQRSSIPQPRCGCWPDNR